MTFTFKALNCRATHRAPCVNPKPIFKIQRIIIFLVILTFFNFFGLATLLSHSAHALFRNKIISTEKWLENWKPNCIWELGGDFWRFDESTHQNTSMGHFSGFSKAYPTYPILVKITTTCKRPFMSPIFFMQISSLLQFGFMSIFSPTTRDVAFYVENPNERGNNISALSATPG